MSEDKSELDKLKVVYPLWMPRGSVRAILTLIVLGSIWFLIFTNKTINENLQDALLMLLGYYFAMRRGKSSSEGPSPSAPLWLPGGSIRIFIFLGFAVLTYVLYTKHQLFDNRAFPLLLLTWGFFLGYFPKMILHRWEERMSQNVIFQFLGHTKAILTIAVVLAFCICVIFEKEALLPVHSSKAFMAILGFYFGNR